MAPCQVLSVGSVWVKRFLCNTRLLSAVSQLRYQEIVRGQRSTACQVSQRKSSIQGSTSEGLRLFAPLQIKTVSPFPTKNSCYSSSLFCFANNLKFSRIDSNVLCKKPFVFTPARNFHVRHSKPTSDDDDIKEKVTNVPKTRKQKRGSGNDNNGNSTAINALLIYGAVALSTSALCFGFLGIDDGSQDRSKISRVIIGSPPNELVTNLNKFDIVYFSVLATCAGVYGVWKIPAIRAIMTKYYLLHNPLHNGSQPLAMLRSMLSHSSFLHLFFNMYVLKSFMNAWDSIDDTERGRSPKGLSSANKMLAFFLAAGMMSGWASVAVKILGGVTLPSLGASGAVMGFVAYVCYKRPDSRLMIAFLPNWTFSAASGLKGIAIFDTVGLLVGIATRWRYYVIDHAGHLGGLLFGLWYVKYGEAPIHHFCTRVAKAVKGPNK